MHYPKAFEKYLICDCDFNLFLDESFKPAVLTYDNDF